MKKVFIRFPTTGKICHYESSLDLETHDEVLVETENILEVGIVIKEPEQNFPSEAGTGTILRKLTNQDKVDHRKLKAVAGQYIEEAKEKTLRHGLDIKILDAELSFDQKKLTFYFSADGRVDFRSLVSDMAKSFNKLIRLQQVGARDEARYFGGIGKCGRELCCRKFLNNLESITLEMAQVQALSTAGSAKLSGCCGKLMCCLSYEAQNYEDLKKKMPKIGSEYKSSQVIGKVVEHNILEGKVVVETPEGKKVEVILGA
ncbi:MAG: regulatory iron-sulfur-containing complex subunit RicT [Patescibacteria group bacterium]